MTEARESLASGRLLLAFACGLFVTGITNTFVVFFPPLLAEFGGSRTATASTVTLVWAGAAVLGPVSGWAVTRWNPRAVVSLGLLATSLGFGIGALAGSLPLFTLAVGVGAGIGVGLTGMVTQAALLADAYVRRRGAAMGIAFSGAMAGYVLAPPCQWAISRFGWRATLAAYVVAVAALIPLAWAVLPSRLRAAGSQGASPSAPRDSTVRRVIASGPFWLLLVVFTTPPIFGNLATTQHSLYLTERGFSADAASVMLGIGGVLAASGRVLFGHHGRPRGSPAGRVRVPRLHDPRARLPARPGGVVRRAPGLRLRAVPLPAHGLASHDRRAARRADRAAGPLRGRLRARSASATAWDPRSGRFSRGRSTTGPAPTS